MSVRGGSSSRGRGRPPGPIPPPVTQPKGTIVPHPVTQTHNKFQVLGTVPKPYASVLASQPQPFDVYANPPKATSSNVSQTPVSDYQVHYDQNLFHIELSMKNIKDPVKLAAQYFPTGWHFIPLAPYKSLMFYKDILIETESVFIKPIYANDDKSKLLYHSLYIKQVLNLSDWGSHPSDLKSLNNHSNPYCYYDYIEAWNKIMLHQNEDHSHSWFFQFDQKFKSQFPKWFILWWTRHGINHAIFPEPLLVQLQHFVSHSNYLPKYEEIPAFLIFCSKYKIPWILKWQYTILATQEVTVFQPPSSSGDRTVQTVISPIYHLSRRFYIKWWDKFGVDRIVGQVQKEFPPSPSPPLSIPSVTQAQAIASSSKSSVKAIEKSKEKSIVPPDVSDVSSYSNSQLRLLADAIHQRLDQLTEQSDTASLRSGDGSQNLEDEESSDPYGTVNLQDAQDPFS